jgi:superfamily I DNA/RNA helicase
MNETWWVDPKQLDEDQKGVIDLPGYGSYLVLGPPGCGKTNLLLLRATYMVRAGKPNVQVIVLTRTLQEFIASGSNNYAFLPDRVKTSQMWAIQLLNEYGITPAKHKKFDVQRKQLIAQVAELIEQEQISNIYDIIFLDEAQDYLPDEIEVFSKLAVNLFAVADNKQKIYKGISPIESIQKYADKTLNLNYHYRNGQKICRLAEEVIKKNDTIEYKFLSSTSNYDEVARPSTVELIKCTDFDEQCHQIIEKLKIQMLAYPDEMLGVVCPRHEELDLLWEYISGSELAEKAILQSGNYGYVPFDQNATICVCTVHSAKGLEFRALVVAGSDFLTRFPLSRNMVFTAITRSKTSFSVYYSKTIPGFLESAFSALSPPPAKPKLEDLFGGGH